MATRGQYCANAFRTKGCGIEIESLQESLYSSCANVETAKIASANVPDATDELESWWQQHEPSYSAPSYAVSRTEGTWPFRATVTLGTISIQGLPGVTHTQAKRNAAREWLRCHGCFAGSTPRAPDPSELPMPKFHSSVVFYLDADACPDSLCRMADAAKARGIPMHVFSSLEKSVDHVTWHTALTIPVHVLLTAYISMAISCAPGYTHVLVGKSVYAAFCDAMNYLAPGTTLVHVEEFDA